MQSLCAGCVPHVVGCICFLIQILQSRMQLADLMKGPLQLQEEVKQHFLKPEQNYCCPPICVSLSTAEMPGTSYPTKKKFVQPPRLSSEQKEIGFFNAESSLDLSLLLGNVRKGVNLQSSREFPVLFLIPHTFWQKAGLRLQTETHQNIRLF